MSTPTIPILPPIKRGDTFELSCVYKQDGVAIDVTALTIRSQVRDPFGSLVEELIITQSDQTTYPGMFSLAAAAPIAWAAGLLSCDIQFSSAGLVQSTQTFKIPVIDDVTKELAP